VRLSGPYIEGWVDLHGHTVRAIRHSNSKRKSVWISIDHERGLKIGCPVADVDAFIADLQDAKAWAYEKGTQ
jgi:hypothetical protein